VAILTCEDCGKACNGIQGIRGHRRGCPGRRQVALNQVREPQEPVVEPDKPVSRAPNQQITLGSLLNVEAVEKVLGIYDPARCLREQLRDSLPIREMLDAVARANKWPTYDDWLDLARDVARLELAAERILQQARVSRDEPWTLHQLAITVRDRWVSWRRDEAYRAWEKQHASKKDGEHNEPTGDDMADVLESFGIPELESTWNRVIDGLRWLTAHTRHAVNEDAPRSTISLRQWLKIS
jgi:hypothetical protein